jgi:hypothetical protein
MMADQNDVPNNNAGAMLGGLPIQINPHIPKDEIWLVTAGKSQKVHIHEGQQAGETVEQWLTKPKVYRIVNIGDPFDIKPQTIERPKKDLEIGDWLWPDDSKNNSK